MGRGVRASLLLLALCVCTGAIATYWLLRVFAYALPDPHLAVQRSPSSEHTDAADPNTDEPRESDLRGENELPKKNDLPNSSSASRPHAIAADKDVEVLLPPDASLLEVSQRLARQGITDHPILLAAYLWLRGASGHVRQGPLMLHRGEAPVAVLRRIAEGYGPSWVRVTLPEGATAAVFAQRLAAWDVVPAPDFLDVVSETDMGARGRGAEGYLFPDTYEFKTGSDARRVVDRLLRAWRNKSQQLMRSPGLSSLATMRGWQWHERVTLASIVEKEASDPKEMPIIAGVFYNRMRDPAFVPKRLQSDPTVVYGCKQKRTLPCREAFDAPPDARVTITKAMLRDKDNPYNTYQLEGLPPGPIGNPSADAMAAVLAPAKHDYLYFVADGEGHHRFSRTLREHQESVNQYRTRHQRAGAR